MLRVAEEPGEQRQDEPTNPCDDAAHGEQHRHEIAADIERFHREAERRCDKANGGPDQAELDAAAVEARIDDRFASIDPLIVIERT
jgi:hypothetical protein